MPFVLTLPVSELWRNFGGWLYSVTESPMSLKGCGMVAQKQNGYVQRKNVTDPATLSMLPGNQSGL